jgi:putative iron-regulated protein
LCFKHSLTLKVKQIKKKENIVYTFNFKTINFVATGLIGLGLMACENVTVPEENLDASAAIIDVPNKVFYPTYADLSTKAGLLQDAVTLLSLSPSDSNLTAAKQAWREARRPWEQAEGFLFGPAVTKGVDAAIDSWPLNQTDLENVIKSGKPLTKGYVDGLADNLKGYHTIEYLLFGTGSKMASALTIREMEYLIAATASLKASIDLLKQSWDLAGGNFLTTFQSAGNGSVVYKSQRAAVEELLNGMIGICDEVANGKISDPFIQKKRTLEESRFSDNSTADFADNIRSVRNVYLGSYGSDPGNGIKSVLEKKDTVLAKRVVVEIDMAIQAVLLMTPTFGEALFNSPVQVSAARAAIQKLKATLEGPVKELLLP